MEVENAELKLKEMAHSEQHYFNRYACSPPSHALQPTINQPLANGL